ncbi:NERD domain protein [Oscillatoria nigro-viridis PCC 7112]|uniref:NERD domain protein n=1 Tax=Phormidium nigroviride PCC 7112 TaxID=179408 RepID=K9VQC2_9CYAN|nr:hypothetical protein [Oscillatoria nigro-viridis]AFZ10288.1 NERD domain protein [Oscillatoria nigro-viridis PCC 7112]
MSKKKRKKEKTSAQANNKNQSKGFATRRVEKEFTGFTYHKMSSPLEGMTEDERVEFIKKLGENFEQQFETSFETLQKQIFQVEPCSLLSFFAYYDLTTSPGINREWTEKNPILQHHVEFLQGLLLQHSQDSFDFRPALPQDFVEFRQLVQDVTRGFNMKSLSLADPSTTIEQHQKLITVEGIRADTQAVRNWGYPQQVKRIVSDLFSSLDDTIEQRIGVRVGCLVEMWFQILDIVEYRINQHRNLTLPSLRAKSIKIAIKKYYQAFPDLTSSPEDLSAYVQEEGLTLDGLRAMIFSQSDLRLKHIYTLTLDTFVDAYPKAVNPEALKDVLNAWSLSFGDLSDWNPEHLFLGNPVWHKPLIKLEVGTYFCPIITLFLNYFIDIMEAIIKPHADIYKKYEERRGNFLEQEIYQLFQKAFPSAKVYQGSEWFDPTTKQTFETDLLVLLDSYLLVVEAKSGRVTEATKRGAFESLKKIVKKLMVEPSIQSKRFCDYLIKNPGLHQLKNRKGELNEVDCSQVREVVRLSITLESLGTLFCRSTDLKQAGLIASDLEMSPTMSLADLEIIFEILEGNCDKLHYLGQRTEFEKNSNYSGEEIDLLAFYLDTGFNILNTEFAQQRLRLRGLSNIFNPFFLRELPKSETPKPKPKLTHWWRSIIQHIEAQQPERWTEIGCVLLNFTHDEQIKFEEQFKRIKKIVNKFWQLPDHNNTCIFISEASPERAVVAGFAYKRIDEEKRNRTMENAVDEARSISHVSRVVVIGVDVEQNDYPYSVAAWHLNEDENAF